MCGGGNGVIVGVDGVVIIVAAGFVQLLLLILVTTSSPIFLVCLSCVYFLFYS